VQHREAFVGVEDEVDLDACAGGHAFEDAASGEDRVGRAPAGAVPLQGGAVAVVEDGDGGAGVRHGVTPSPFANALRETGPADSP
jgi:hypothetical protein